MTPAYTGQSSSRGSALDLYTEEHHTSHQLTGFVYQTYLSTCYGGIGTSHSEVLNLIRNFCHRSLEEYSCGAGFDMKVIFSWMSTDENNSDPS